MPTDVAQLILDEYRDRLSALEEKVRDYDSNIQSFYRNEWTKIDGLSQKMEILHTLLQEDRIEHKDLSARVFQCETQLVKMQADIYNLIGELERKALKWLMGAALISGSAGAGVLKILSAGFL